MRPTSRPSPPSAGTPPSPRSAWRTCSPSRTPTRTSTACSSPYDGLSRGIIAALKGSGYGSGGKTLPVVTGQDAELESVKSILADEQYSSVFKNTQDLAKSTVAMIQEILDKKTVTVNDTTSYNNGIKVVPTQLLDPVAVDKSNIEQVLLDAKYYTADQLKS